MAVEREEVEAFLAHYSSDTYDPVKAHEYYLKNRELQGRKSTKGMSETQKQAVTYSKHQIGVAKKAELTSTQASQKARLEDIRKRTTESAARIREKLVATIDKLKADAESAGDNAQVNTIPANASPKVRAYLERQNAIIRGRVGSAAKFQASEAIKKARESSSAEIKKLGSDMKAAVTSARDAYTEARKQLVAKYEQAAATEFDNIRTQLPGAPPKVKKPRSAASTKPR